MNACGTGELGESCDASLDVRRGHHHQVGKLIDDANNVRQLAVWHFIQSKLIRGTPIVLIADRSSGVGCNGRNGLRAPAGRLSVARNCL